MKTISLYSGGNEIAQTLRGVKLQLLIKHIRTHPEKRSKGKRHQWDWKTISNELKIILFFIHQIQENYILFSWISSGSWRCPKLGFPRRRSWWRRMNIRKSYGACLLCRSCTNRTILPTSCCCQRGSKGFDAPSTTQWSKICTEAHRKTQPKCKARPDV